jgi:hypothetical protein
MKVLPVPVASVKQDALAPLADGFQHAGDCDLLVVAPLPGTALVLERDGGEAVAPGTGGRCSLRKGLCPERLRPGEGRDIALEPGRHVRAVDGLPVGAVGESHRELRGVGLGLAQAFGVRAVPSPGLDNGEFRVAVDQHVVRDFGAGAPPLPGGCAGLQAPEGDPVLAQDPAAVHYAPTRGLQRGVYMLGAGLGCVHGWRSV